MGWPQHIPGDLPSCSDSAFGSVPSLKPSFQRSQQSSEAFGTSGLPGQTSQAVRLQPLRDLGRPKRPELSRGEREMKRELPPVSEETSGILRGGAEISGKENVNLNLPEASKM